MTRELDAKGLDAAQDAVDDAWHSEHTLTAAEVADIAIRAYFAATRQEPDREPDRVAVAVNADGQATALYMHPQFDAMDWKLVESQAVYYGFTGPFARAIVECHLPRPPEPVTVKGRVKG